MPTCLKTLLGLLPAAAFLLVPGATVFAKPPHKAALVRHYGDAVAKKFHECATCHLTDDEISALPTDDPAALQVRPWNALGKRLMELAKGEQTPGPIIDRLRKIADEDADGDGIANELELLAGTSPSKKDEKPADAERDNAAKRLAEFRQRLPNFVWNPFTPVVRPALPNAGGEWNRNPIDAFVAAEHARLGLKPRPEAAKQILLRRVYLDLIGLPPTREELQAFLDDRTPDAYERVVERLLQSPQYGERWGRHWMDVWRYSDWAGWGTQVRDSQPHVWRWRDWIIESLNDDKGYDRMVAEMLAADEMAPTDTEALRATGFLVRNFKLLSREQWLTDTVDHTARAFLGVTMKCAQCHDHRYDLLTHEEYYQFRAIFEPYKVRIDPLPGLDPAKEGIARAFDATLDAPTYLYRRGDERDPDKSKTITPGAPRFIGGGDLTAAAVTLPPEGFYPMLQPQVAEQAVRKAQADIAAAEAALTKAREQVAQKVSVTSSNAPENPPLSPEVVLAERNVAAAQLELASFQARFKVERVKFLTPATPNEEIKALALAASKAEKDAALAKTEAALLAAEQPLPAAREKAASDEKQKKALADLEKKVEEAKKARDAALAASQTPGEGYSPLGPIYPNTSTGRRLALARWIVNPAHPLTVRVAANHIWARHFGRGLVPSLDELGQNRKQPTHPALLDWLAAELVQPTIGASEKTAGWSMKHLHRLIVNSSTYRTASTHDTASAAIDPDNLYLWRTTARRVEAEVIRDAVLHVAGRLELAHGGAEIDQQQGLAVARRSLYFRHAPEKQMVFLQLFDMAAPSECYERRESVVPQQALALANSELTVIQARHLARRLAGEAAADSAIFVQMAFQQILSRTPAREEQEACTAFLTQRTQDYQERASELTDGASNPADATKPAADAALRARESLVHVLLNHHEFVTIP